MPSSVSSPCEPEAGVGESHARTFSERCQLSRHTGRPRFPRKHKMPKVKADASKSNVAQVQDLFLAEVQKHGIQHALEWVTGWYERIAMARVRDEMEGALGTFIEDQEARELWLTDQLEDAAKRVSNRSTSAGHELAKDSYVSALARELERSGKPGRRERWDALRARTAAAPVAA